MFGLKKLSFLGELSRRSNQYSERHIWTFGIIGVFVIPLSYFIERIVGSPSYDTLWIRLFSAIVAIPLLTQFRFRPWFHIYWTVGITIVFLINFGLMLLLNAAYTPSYEQASPIWVYQYIVALFFFIQLIRSGYLAIPLWLCSIGLLILVYMGLPDPNWISVRENCVYPLPVFVTAMLAGILTNRNTQVIQTEQLRAASAIGSNIAHELRTPLASIRSLSRGIQKYLPRLLEGYRKAQDHDLDVEKIRPDIQNQLEIALDSIAKEVEHSNTIIDMLLVNTTDRSFSEAARDTFLASQGIDEALTRYPFNSSTERKLLHKDIDQDFTIVAPRILIVHVLFNLIKNGLYYVQSAGKGEIKITAKLAGKDGQIVVHDTGAGISPESRRHLFDRFYTTIKTGEGAGIGLSFCKMVMDAIDGSIECDSEEGEYTTFTLSFPLSG